MWCVVSYHRLQQETTQLPHNQPTPNQRIRGTSGQIALSLQNMSYTPSIPSPPPVRDFMRWPSDTPHPLTASNLSFRVPSTTRCSFSSRVISLAMSSSVSSSMSDRNCERGRSPTLSVIWGTSGGMYLQGCR